MNHFSGAVSFIADPANWPGAGGIAERLGEHLWYSVLAVALALIIALPLGLYLGHTGKGASGVIAATGALRAIPSLGLLTWLTLEISFGIQLPIVPSTIVLLILAVPPVLAATVSGVATVSRPVVDAARAMGHNEGQIITRIELPLAAPTIVGGVRSCVLQVLATATISAYIGLGGLGRYLLDGLALRDYEQMLVGAILVSLLALAADVTLALLQHRLRPKGVTS
ncbi:ABC transporter permease [Corynebacterium sp. CCM 8835]|uniref:ABC transporter permease n=1 Tax=Corynebacterium antarcticum TaxID=2800405 RepID=A0A9Q4GNF1_9CORY|nr:ABC transporter permease [Corynebacterium antarcticum]MCK7643239.1 ABC transporter permease [Corynebacterium antarcticum]MCK7661742.1 ABC transporter permease [Corynebacterium antarcticum]MCL0246599.1 ABC transporter permease [Corynebacterium antarcticum]MCX7492740.1 ABC transporter permease [Corynebacterium antarcticum]MCX7538766.1 ABC transporter permease [Corynebacterium antarcticum]